MTIKNSILKIAAFSVAAFSVVACDNDFETIGSNVIGEPGFNADLYDEAEITATSYNLPPVQTNNLPVNLLGYYNHEVYGGQTANLLTQLYLSQPNPEFGNEPSLDSVVLKIPYFSTELEAEEDEAVTYELDSILGDDPMKLSIIESNYFLNIYDPESGFEEAQKYYSNMQPEIESNLTQNVLYQTDNFVPSSEEIVEYGFDEDGVEDTLYQGPALRVKLPAEYFQNKILDKEGSPELVSNSNFVNYIRGLYFKVEPVNNSGSMMLLNPSHQNAGITLYYTNTQVDTNDADEDEDVTEEIVVRDSFELNFTMPGSTPGRGKVNLFEQEMPEFQEENLYLKGGEGSMAIIELFDGPDSDGDGVSDELEFLRDNDWLINEANLSFYVNRDAMSNSVEPEQLYLYDLDNDRILADYIFETAGEANELTSRASENFSFPLEKDGDGNGIKYRIRLTEHINNLLNKDSTNVKLGLVVSQNLNLISNSAVKNSENSAVDKVPTGSVISPLGTVLHGPESDDEEKALRLRIYYTESKD